MELRTRETPSSWEEFIRGKIGMVINAVKCRREKAINKKRGE
jgi:hypothetical protein